MRVDDEGRLCGREHARPGPGRGERRLEGEPRRGAVREVERRRRERFLARGGHHAERERMERLPGDEDPARLQGREERGPPGGQEVGDLAWIPGERPAARRRLFGQQVRDVQEARRVGEERGRAADAPVERALDDVRLRAVAHVERVSQDAVLAGLARRVPRLPRQAALEVRTGREEEAPLLEAQPVSAIAAVGADRPEAAPVLGFAVFAVAPQEARAEHGEPGAAHEQRVGAVGGRAVAAAAEGSVRREPAVAQHDLGRAFEDRGRFVDLAASADVAGRDVDGALVVPEVQPLLHARPEEAADLQAGEEHRTTGREVADEDRPVDLHLRAELGHDAQGLPLERHAGVGPGAHEDGVAVLRRIDGVLDPVREVRVLRVDDPHVREGRAQQAGGHEKREQLHPKVSGGFVGRRSRGGLRGAQRDAAGCRGILARVGRERELARSAASVRRLPRANGPCDPRRVRG